MDETLAQYATIGFVVIILLIMGTDVFDKQISAAIAHLRARI